MKYKIPDIKPTYKIYWYSVTTTVAAHNVNYFQIHSTKICGNIKIVYDLISENK